MLNDRAVTTNPAGSPKIRDTTPRGAAPPSESSAVGDPDAERVSLYPLDPVVALKGLLAVDPQSKPSSVERPESDYEEGR